eukprot:gene11791-11936_t
MLAPQPVNDNGPVFSPVSHSKSPDPYDARPRSTYLSWDDYFMAVAFLSAERSKDPNKQVVHAEANALLNKNQAQIAGARIYVTLFPCNECAKLLIQAGIKEVIFHEAKLEPTGKRPATMEQAAAEDDAADGDQQQTAVSGVHQPNLSNICSITDQQAVGKTNAANAAAQGSGGSASGRKPLQHFSVGASVDVDASYVASQRLLTMAGRNLLQLQPTDSEFLINQLANNAVRTTLRGNITNVTDANIARTGTGLGFSTLNVPFTTNGFIAGASKRMQDLRQAVTLILAPYTNQASSNETRANTDASAEYSSITQPLADVLMAAVTDYTTAGDSVIVTTLTNTNRLRIRNQNDDVYGLDYDYGAIQPIPQSSTAGTSQSTTVDPQLGRAAAGGATSGVVTAPSARLNSRSISTSLRGIVAARRANDTFGAGQVTTPPAVALCIATSTLMVTIFETQLLCVMAYNYYILMLGLCVLASGIAFFLVPETAQVPLEQAAAVWALVQQTRRHPRFKAKYDFPSYGKEWICTDRQIFKELVKPGSQVLDYRTELTGVTAKDLEGIQTDRQTVAARIKALLAPGTVLVGHSLHYDLEALKLDHQPVIDTAMIFSYQ